MKWRGCFLFFLLSFYFITAARGQLITFSVKNERLEKVFLLIEQQSDHHFIYTTEQIEKAKPVTLSVSNEQLSSVLDKCFSGQPLLYNINEKNITVKEKKVVASERPLKGKILDQNGNPVRGVTINIKGTPLVVASDANGEFGFDNAPLNVTLMLTSVEIEPLERYVGDLSFVEMRVSIKVGVLDETLVIAYGKTSRRYSTGTVSGIKQDQINDQPVSNVLSVLAGRVTGLQVSQASGVPGSFIRLQLRGQNSIANGKDPLIIIDGIPFPSQPLNGALGGGAGVSSSPLNALNPADIESVDILKDADATSIYGSRGANGVILITTRKPMRGTTKVNFKLHQGWGTVSRKMELMNTNEYLQMRREAYSNDGVTPGLSDAPDLLAWDTSRYTDWQKVLIGRTMKNTDGNLSVAGGNSQTQFLLSAGWHRQTTVFPGDFDEDRKSINLSVTHAPIDQRLRLTFSAGFSNYHNLLPQDDFFSDITLAPNAPPIYNADGKLNWENSTWVNPMAKRFATFDTRTDNLNSSIDLSYKLLRDLQLKFSGGFSSLWSSDLVQSPQASFNPAWGIASQAGFGSKTIRTLIAEPQIEYNCSFKKNKVNALAGITTQESRQRGLYQSATGYATDDLLSSIRSAGHVTTMSETDIKYRYAGVFARLGYDYDRKYILSFTARRDGSSRYGEENRFANFGSIAAVWIFSNEKLLKKSALSFGKLKLSAGITGNDQIGDYKYLKLYSPGSYSYLGVIPFYPAQHYNPKFSWEKVRKLEADIDLGFLQNRLLVTVNYYHNTTTNQLVNYPLPAMTGFSGILRNIPAKIRNTGWEIELNGKIVSRKKWSWSTSFNLTIPRNKLLAFESLSSSSYASQYVIGQPLSIVKKLNYTGINETTGLYTFRDFNNDGKVSLSLDQQQILFTGQQYYGGLNNSVTVGKFSASMLIQFVRQKHGYNYLYFFAQPGLAYNEPRFLTDRWIKPGDAATYQRYTYSDADAGTAFFNYSQSDAAYSDASYIRFRSVSVSYEILKDKAGKQCIIFFQGHNLFTITRYKGLDPENLSQSVPPVRMVVAGIQLTL